MNKQDRIFIVDDDPLIRQSLSELLEAAGFAIECFSGAKEFLDFCTQHTRGCLILDLKMPVMDGAALHAELNARKIQLPVIFLTGYGSIAAAVSAIRSGAMDFLTKPVDCAVLLARVREALERNRSMAARIEERNQAAVLIEKLTERETEVMELVLAGHANKEIARIMGISARTVEAHRYRIVKKTGVANRKALENLVMLARK